MHYIQRRGLFDALYVDRASHFKTTRHGGLHYEVSAEQADTQIQRALAELGIAILYAHTPQAKGRVERLFRFFQDRLIKEMRLAGITDYTQANRFLQEQFLPWYNQQYTRWCSRFGGHARCGQGQHPAFSGTGVSVTAHAGL